MLILFTATIFLGALLLFTVQPLMARMALPLLGGSPAVWNTAMVFYQAVLLAGYGYAHLSTKRLGLRRQALVHLGVVLLPFLVLPLAIPAGWRPPTDSNPLWWLLGLMTVAVGLPFFVVSSTSSLVQKWFTTSGHRAAGDPYFLYAASNLGSLVALVGYPVVVEPWLTLPRQTRWWAAGYAVLAALLYACAWWVRRAQPAAVEEPVQEGESEGPVTGRRRLRWVALAFVPCSLMLSVTTYQSSELAPMPLLWVIPLGIYLLTFSLVFARRPLVPHRWMVRALPVLVVAAVVTLVAHLSRPVGLVIGVHLATLFVVGMVCHGEIAHDRPPTRYLTEFYLWMSVGGVLGGVFNALLAPLLFSTVIEHPLTLVLACLLAPAWRPQQRSEQQTHILDYALPVIVGLGTAAFIQVLRGGVLPSVPLSLGAMFTVPSVACLGLCWRPIRFGLGLAAVLVASTFALGENARQLHVERSFFGIHRVNVDAGGGYHRLHHGNTVHGKQSLDPTRRREPLTYYTRTGPLGQTFAALGEDQKRRTAVVGLGAGSLACYGTAGQHWTFYEIDPAVERIARDSRYFTFLADCPATAEVVLGDACLSLESSRDGAFGFLVLDAYSSDAIPVHLITREALALYLRKLAPHGVLAFHITNRHLTLEPVLANLAQDAGLICLTQYDGADAAERALGKMSSRWVLMARGATDLGPLATDRRWHPATTESAVGVWTDHYASLFRVLGRGKF